MSKKRLAIIGAGPIGLEAALRGIEKGWDVTVFEKGTVGHHLLKWKHIRFFTPLKDNISPRMVAALADVPDGNSFLSGGEFVSKILRPLSTSPALKNSVREGVEVIAVGKRRLLKTEMPGHPIRADRPFRLVLAPSDGPTEVSEADAVLDASGVYGFPNWAGESGLPCPGERENSSYFVRHLPDVLVADKAEWIGKNILLVGDGHSAATAAAWLGELRKENVKTNLFWVVNGDRSRPCVEAATDPLPERKQTVERANDLAEHPPAGWGVFRKSALLGLREEGGAVLATIGRDQTSQTVSVDKILSLTGYRPNTAFLEELQVQFSPVTGGAGGLAKSLLSITDCLAKVEVPPESLESGEKNFYMVGHKSYGRLNTFLLRSGMEQLDVIFSRLV